MTASPWAPANAGRVPEAAPAPGQFSPVPGGYPPAGSPPPPARPPRGPGPRLWAIIAAFSTLVLVAIALTAVITAGIVKTSAPSTPPAAAPSTPAAPQYTAGQQDSAKQNVCQAFDAGERGNTGAVVVNGDLNVPTVLRILNAQLTVRNALSPAVPTDVADAAHKYLSTSADLTTAALANGANDKLVDLTKTNNSAIDDFASACGLPH